jgi:ABC-type transport system involved in cytochrome bd biosynthesis fused ATPase/permease subunit
VSDLRRLLTWLERARPPRRALAGALFAGFLATLSGAALSIGAVALLVESALRPGLAAVAGVLIVIELLAFLRSPIRFFERVSAHRLGLAAVTQWRRWLVRTVSGWSYHRWRAQGSGDLLERSLRDTDELQDLWLRGVVPALTSLVAALVADVVLGLLPGRGTWWVTAGLVALAQVIGVALTFARYPALVRADKAVRAQRGRYRSIVVELAGAAPELAALGAGDYTASLAHEVDGELALTEDNLVARGRVLALVAPLATLLALGAVALAHPRSAPLWTVVSVLVAMSTYDYALTWRASLESAVAVSGAAERLDGLDVASRAGTGGWPADSSVHLNSVVIQEGETIVANATLEVPPGRRVALTGASGAGKSALLRAVAGLDAVASGDVRIGDISIAQLDESELRRHVAYVGAEPGLTSGFVRDVIGLGRTLHRDYVNDLASVGLDVTPDTRWSDLSRGERQRIAVVRALATSPDVVILDEPTSGLGASETAMVLALLADSAASVLVATHDPQVMRWCDVVVELAEGILIRR